MEPYKIFLCSFLVVSFLASELALLISFWSFIICLYHFKLIINCTHAWYEFGKGCVIVPFRNRTTQMARCFQHSLWIFPWNWSACRLLYKLRHDKVHLGVAVLSRPRRGASKSYDSWCLSHNWHPEQLGWTSQDRPSEKSLVQSKRFPRWCWTGVGEAYQLVTQCEFCGAGTLHDRIWEAVSTSLGHGCCYPTFSAAYGIHIVAFYSPSLFQSVGLRHSATLLSSIVLGLVNLLSTIVSAFLVDQFGRRFLFITGGIVMLLCQVRKY